MAEMPPLPGAMVLTVPQPCGCRVSGVDGYVYPCPDHRIEADADCDSGELDHG